MSTPDGTVEVRDDNPQRLHSPCLPCQAAHRTRPADTGRTVCFHCCNRILGWLRDVEDAIFTIAPGVGGEGRRAPGFGSRSPARDDVMAVLDPRSDQRRMFDVDGDLSIRPLFATLDAIVVQLAEAQQHRLRDGWWTVTRLVAYIRRSQPYWSACDWSDDLASQLADLAGMVKRLQGEHRPKRIGTCPTLVRGEECGEALFAPLDGDTIRCRKCRREWQRTDWLRLGRLLESA